MAIAQDAIIHHHSVADTRIGNWRQGRWELQLVLRELFQREERL
ncbi:MAG TPA: hypothetical protein VN684_05435 [Terriglobales bacterium]|nr:hypothetical protein [Terriglobales bacterium]